MAKEEQIKTSIDLTGEKEYRAACTNINSSLREIGSEMKLTTAEFADNADSVEALTAKQKLLQKQFDEQAKKAEAAEKALKKMRDNGIEPTNPAYQKMQTNLNNTKADMVKIQKEIDDTSKKLKSSKVDWESVGETVGKAGKAIGAACAAMGAAIAAAGAAFFGLKESDIITCHCPLTNETKGMINEETITKMKKSAIFINTSRGPVVDEKALANALNNEMIQGAGLDVLSVEPADKDNPLLNAKNCYITPHIAWAAKETRARLLGILEDNLKAYIDGHAQNVVNK